MVVLFEMVNAVSMDVSFKVDIGFGKNGCSISGLIFTTEIGEDAEKRVVVCSILSALRSQE